MELLPAFVSSMAILLTATISFRMYDACVMKDHVSFILEHFAANRSCDTSDSKCELWFRVLLEDDNNHISELMFYNGDNKNEYDPESAKKDPNHRPSLLHNFTSETKSVSVLLQVLEVDASKESASYRDDMKAHLINAERDNFPSPNNKYVNYIWQYDLEYNTTGTGVLSKQYWNRLNNVFRHDDEPYVDIAMTFAFNITRECSDAATSSKPISTTASRTEPTSRSLTTTVAHEVSTSDDYSSVSQSTAGVASHLTTNSSNTTYYQYTMTNASLESLWLDISEVDARRLLEIAKKYGSRFYQEDVFFLKIDQGIKAGIYANLTDALDKLFPVNNVDQIDKPWITSRQAGFFVFTCFIMYSVMSFIELVKYLWKVGVIDKALKVIRFKK